MRSARTKPIPKTRASGLPGSPLLDRLARGLSRALGLAAAALLPLLISQSVLAAHRFPPPDFQSGYELPESHTPSARQLWLEYGDALILLAALVAATYLALKRRSRRGVATVSILSLLYFGFYRQGCICAIGAVQNVSLAMFDPGYAVPMTALAFFFLPLIFALFVGRTFCSSVCPHGAIQDLVLIKPVRVPAWAETGLGMVPYLYLGAAVLFAATGSAFIICKYDPFVPIFRLSGGFLMVAAGVGFLVTAMFVGRPYCRFLCPLGALLRVGSTVSKWRVSITPGRCTGCRLCAPACPFGAIREPLPGDAPPLEERRRGLSLALVAIPLLIVAGACLGRWTSDAASRAHPDVALAERLTQPEDEIADLAATDPDRLEWSRAQANREEVIEDAALAKKRFALGGWIFGGWAGLVAGVSFTGLAARRNHPGFEPDSGRCVACARCFSACPEEQTRRADLATKREWESRFAASDSRFGLGRLVRRFQSNGSETPRHNGGNNSHGCGAPSAFLPTPSRGTPLQRPTRVASAEASAPAKNGAGSTEDRR